MNAEQRGLFDHELPPGFHVGQRVVGLTRYNTERRGIVRGINERGDILIDCGEAGIVGIRAERVTAEPDR